MSPFPLTSTFLTLFLLASFLSAETPYATTTSTSKRGLAWPNSNYVPMTGFENVSTTITSYYTWSPNPVYYTSSSSYSSSSSAAFAPFPFIPMLWGCNTTYTSPFNVALNHSFSGASLTSDRVVLGFNEPDQSGQSNCTPQQAAQAWKTFLEPLKGKGYRLGSPAVTSGSTGETWLLNWFSQCAGGCNPDFIALHWYDMSTENLIATLETFHTTFNLPIWVTEMAVQNFTTVNSSTSVYGTQASLPQIKQIMNETMSWLDNTSWIERYFWFGAMYDMGVNDLNTLFIPSGETKRTGALNELGVMYAGSNGTYDGLASLGGPTSSHGRKTLAQVMFSKFVGVILTSLVVLGDSWGCLYLNI